jgi:hypothetical protein
MVPGYGINVASFVAGLVVATAADFGGCGVGGWMGGTELEEREGDCMEEFCV